MTRRYDQTTDDPIVKRLFQCLMSDEEIAARVGVAPRAVEAARFRMGLGRPKGRVPKAPPAVELPPAMNVTGPMAVAMMTFGSRLKEVGGCYRLDNTPIGFFALMKETNRVRAGLGLDQVGPAEWRV